jgi:putative flavoprotein involved in K+ transport
MERVAAIVIGAGQAGLSMSHELAARGVEHVVLESGRVAETWRTRRWKTFRLVSPNWLNRVPGFWYDGNDPHGFFATAEMIDYLERYAASFQAPVRPGVTVTSVVRAEPGFVVKTSHGDLAADSVVVATGAFGRAFLPPMAGALPAAVHSIHTDQYWAPEDLPPGGVVVVGAGQSGLQIADELARAGRDVRVAVGRHGWVPRRLWGRDQNQWRLENGDYASVIANPDEPVAEYPFTPLSRWGVVDFNLLTISRNGVRFTGRLEAIVDGRLCFAPNLRELLLAGDEFARKFIARIFEFARSRGEGVPEPALANAWPSDALPAETEGLDLARERISTVIWATGYRQDFSWIQVPGALSPAGAPYQRKGASPVDGLFFVGLHRGWHAGDGTVLGASWLPEHLGEVIAASKK